MSFFNLSLFISFLDIVLSKEPIVVSPASFVFELHQLEAKFLRNTLPKQIEMLKTYNIFCQEGEEEEEGADARIAIYVEGGLERMLIKNVTIDVMDQLKKLKESSVLDQLSRCERLNFAEMAKTIVAACSRVLIETCPYLREHWEAMMTQQMVSVGEEDFIIQIELCLQCERSNIYIPNVDGLPRQHVDYFLKNLKGSTIDDRELFREWFFEFMVTYTNKS